MHLQDVIQFQASTTKERRLLGKYCDYLMKDWLHLQGNFFLKYFTSPFRRKQLFVVLFYKCTYAVRPGYPQNHVLNLKLLRLIDFITSCNQIRALPI